MSFMEISGYTIKFYWLYNGVFASLARSQIITKHQATFTHLEDMLASLIMANFIIKVILLCRNQQKNTR